MTPEQITIARRVTASPYFRWMPGMRWVVHRPNPFDDVYGRVADFARDEDLRVGVYGRPVPVMFDPATIGCLHALACERWGAACITPIVCAIDGDACWLAIDGAGEEMNRGVYPSADKAVLRYMQSHVAAIVAALLHEVTP
jgi:hypothetical protein